MQTKKKKRPATAKAIARKHINRAIKKVKEKINVK
jgi:hypothetical protein